MRTIALFTTILGLNLAANAQYIHAGGGGFSMGVQTLETTQLPQFATVSPVLSTTNVSMGGYGYFQFGNFLAGFGGAGIFGVEVEDAINRYTVSSGYFTLDLGYKVVNKNKWAAYPILKVGFAGVDYNINSLAEVVVGGETPNFNSVTYSWGNFTYGGALRIERYFSLKEDCTGSQGGGLLGFEIGYLTSPSSSQWYSSSRTKIMGAPEYQFNSLYAKITIGGFGGI